MPMELLMFEYFQLYSID